MAAARCDECREFLPRQVVLKTKPAYNCRRMRIIVLAHSKPCAYCKPIATEKPLPPATPLF
jgi:hypothetical protein